MINPHLKRAQAEFELSVRDVRPSSSQRLGGAAQAGFEPSVGVCGRVNGMSRVPHQDADKSGRRR